MDVKVHNYAGIVVDTSFFVRPFSEKLLKLLSSAPVYAAQTWRPNLDVVDAGLRDPQKLNFKNNLTELLRYNPQPPAGIGCTTDVVGMILSLEKLGRARGSRYLFVSADQRLCERLILEKVSIDIFDIWTDVILPAEKFGEIGAHFEFVHGEQPPVPTAEASKTLELYAEDGTLLTLRSTTKGGSEATMYECDARPDCLAKIYKKPRSSVILDQNKIENVVNLQKKLAGNPSSAWAMVPLEKLYLEPERRNVVGFLMKKAGEGTLFSELPVLNEEKGKIQVRENIQLCMKLLRQISYLSVYGFSVYDCNPQNFAYSPSNPENVKMMDADSFCGGNYFTRFTPDLYLRRLFEFGKTTKLESIRICTETMYVFIVYLLRRKVNPLFPNGELRPEDETIWSRVPRNIRNMFRLVFTDELGYLPQFDLLLHELQKADKMLEGNGLTYEDTEVLDSMETAEEPGAEEKVPGPEQDGNAEEIFREKPHEKTSGFAGPAKDTRRKWDDGFDYGEDAEPEPEYDSYDEYDDGYPQFEVDAEVFRPTGWMRIRQAPPSIGPRPRKDGTECHITPAPLRTLYADIDEAEQEETNIEVWKRVRRFMKNALVCFALLVVCWLLFSADPDWVRALRDGANAFTQWVADFLEPLFDAFEQWVPRDIGTLYPVSRL